MDFHELHGQIDGDVVRPGDGAWDVARRAWNLAVDQRPAAVAFPVGSPRSRCLPR